MQIKSMCIKEFNERLAILSTFSFFIHVNTGEISSGYYAIFRLRSTSFLFLVFQDGNADWRSDFAVVSFEDVLSSVPDLIKEDLLFNLDLFL